MQVNNGTFVLAPVKVNQRWSGNSNSSFLVVPSRASLGYPFGRVSLKRWKMVGHGRQGCQILLRLEGDGVRDLTLWGGGGHVVARIDGGLFRPQRRHDVNGHLSSQEAVGGDDGLVKLRDVLLADLFYGVGHSDPSVK